MSGTLRRCCSARVAESVAVAGAGAKRGDVNIHKGAEIAGIMEKEMNGFGPRVAVAK